MSEPIFEDGFQLDPEYIASKMQYQALTKAITPDFWGDPYYAFILSQLEPAMVFGVDGDEAYDNSWGKALELAGKWGQWDILNQQKAPHYTERLSGLDSLMLWLDLGMPNVEKVN
ncbi:MAG: hypothetical protein CL833_16170 [Crocinitomicaceae bacterium]|jgi:hypothetical protein|nr:hypothetical protein [Crocinitomicaceae bacterium]|tara:strand:- start:873 stop:1217 length:345 start_codon:yes stop_codon:yes gene_type:complete